MYEQKEDVRTFLRVHPVPGIMDYLTYTETLPLTYFNFKNQECILIDAIHEGGNLWDSKWGATWAWNMEFLQCQKQILKSFWREGEVQKRRASFCISA